MSTSADAMELGFDLRAARRRRARRFMRVAVPIVTLLILLASIAGIGIYLQQANRSDARVLTDDLLEQLEQRIVAEVVAFLAPAAIMVNLSEEVLGDSSLHELRDRLAEPLSMHILDANPHLATFNFADPDGNFLMVKKSPDGAIDTKFMDRSHGDVTTTWIRRDPAGDVIGTERDPSDDFDPRTRPWYRGAVETGGLYWSDVYIFFTDQRPGITASLPVYAEDGALASVYSIDIALEDLSEFLGGLHIGDFGRALIVDADGVLVAYPRLADMLKRTDRGYERAHVEELLDPVLNRAFDRLRIDGPGKRELVVQGRRYVNTATSLEPTLGRDWSLLIVAPEEDFVGFVAENNRDGLIMSAGVLVLASILAGLLVFQGLRADRNGRLMLRRQRQLEMQSRAFSGLAEQAAFFDSEDQSAVEAFTETVGQTIAARRISVWQLAEDGHRIVCVDAFDKETGGHTGGMAFDSHDLPRYLGSLLQSEEIIVRDAAEDPRTAELHRLYLQRLDCRALTSVPIAIGGHVIGAVWLEDDGADFEHEAGDAAFARAVANMIALRMRPAATHAERTERSASQPDESARGSRPSIPMRQTELATGSRSEAFQRRIAAERDQGARIDADVFQHVTVVAIKFTDDVSLAATLEDEERNAVNDLVQKLESLSEAYGVEYLKILGDQVVGAAGLGVPETEAADAMAGFALEILDYLARLFTRLERPLEFRIGMDTGPVIGTSVGRDQGVFNVWGEAAVTARRMAESGVAGQIQVTESAYRRLREDYLFRVRGLYFLEGHGEFKTYLLTGRL